MAWEMSSALFLIIGFVKVFRKWALFALLHFDLSPFAMVASGIVSFSRLFGYR